MNIEELKQEIEEYTGIEASSLTGETVEENIAQAKALLAYRRETANSGKSPREQFAEWVKARENGTPDLATMALNEIEARTKIERADKDSTTKGDFARWVFDNL